MKILFAFALAVLGAISPAIAEKVATMPAPSGYVNDYAGVMTAPGKAGVEAICREVHDKAKAQIFFVTVKSLDGELIDTFSNDLFHAWKIGEKKTDRGILVLLAVDDHKRRIEVGYGLEGILPDAKAGDIGREMVPALKASDYDEAARVAVTDIADAIAADAKVSLHSTAAAALSDQAPPPVQPAPPSSEIHSISWVFPALLFSSFFGVFGLIVWLQIRRGVRFGGGGTGFSSGGDSFGGSSGESGGSDSFSGGDGGDSGGGGASGDW